MNNKAFNNFINQDFEGLANWFNTLNPYEFTFVATIIGGAIAPLLTIEQQLSLGNFFEQIGQTLETISAQGSVNILSQNNQQRQNDALARDICDLKIQLEKLKRKMNN